MVEYTNLIENKNDGQGEKLLVRVHGCTSRLDSKLLQRLHMPRGSLCGSSGRSVTVTNSTTVVVSAMHRSMHMHGDLSARLASQGEATNHRPCLPVWPCRNPSCDPYLDGQCRQTPLLEFDCSHFSSTDTAAPLRLLHK